MFFLKKNKTKISAYFLLSVIAWAEIFCCSAVNAKILINEIMIASKDSTKNEFVELYNAGDEEVILDKYKLKKKTSGGTESYLLNDIKFLGKISARGYFVIAHPEYKEKINADIGYSGSSAAFNIAENNTVLLYDNKGNLLDKVGFGKSEKLDYKKNPAPNPNEGESIGRLNAKDSEDNSQDFTAQNSSPGKENKETEKNPPTKDDDTRDEEISSNNIYSNKIQITELLPYPNDGEQEFIELYNSGKEDIDLFDWTLHDASKTGEYRFLDHAIIGAKKFLVLMKNVFCFALNNSGQESVILRDPSSNEIFKVTYSSSKKGISYNFNGSAWHWSKFLTPGKENIFEEIPAGELDLDKNIFVNVYANFEIAGLNKNAKVTWDFGDNHKSYLAKTKHKYALVGKYVGSVKFSLGSEDIIRSFEIIVEEISHPKVRIVAINANPAGADTGVETLTIENKEKKKINLLGWSITTGWKKKFINHPIREEFIIKGGKQKEITNGISSFTLNNQKAQIELRYPDGKVAQSVKYKKEGGISEDEVYQKVKGGWNWVGIEKTESNHPALPSLGGPAVLLQAYPNGDISHQNAEIVTQEVTSQQSYVTSKQEIISEITSEEKVSDVSKEVQLPLGKLETEIPVQIEILKPEPKVLGAETVRVVDGKYLFTAQIPEREHYGIVFVKNIFSSLNYDVNVLMNYFWK